MTEIRWNHKNGDTEYSYVGRNGSGKCCGISIYEWSTGICLYPINSRGNNANCLIDIPNEALPQLVRELIPLDKILDAARDRLPTLMGIDPLLDKIIEEELKSGSDHSHSPGQETE